MDKRYVFIRPSRVRRSRRTEPGDTPHSKSKDPRWPRLNRHARRVEDREIRAAKRQARRRERRCAKKWPTVLPRGKAAE